MYRVGDVAIVLHDVKLRKLPLRRQLRFVQRPHILSFKDRDPLGRDIAHKVHKLICVFEGLIDYELCVEVIAHRLKVTVDGWTAGGDWSGLDDGERRASHNALERSDVLIDDALVCHVQVLSREDPLLEGRVVEEIPGLNLIVAVRGR